MNDIKKVLKFLEKRGGTATVDDIFEDYVEAYHILKVREFYEQLMKTFESNDGTSVFLISNDGTYSTTPKKKKTLRMECSIYFDLEEGESTDEAVARLNRVIKESGLDVVKSGSVLVFDSKE